MIELKNVSKTYKSGSKALQHVTLSINDGEFVFIMGKSGSGKSTLLRLLIKEIEPSEGEIMVNDVLLRKLARRYIPKYRRMIGMVFQDFRLLKDLNVFENVAFAQHVVRVPNSKIRETVPQVLRKVGLGSKYKSLPSQLSGGECQRVAIARALVNKPEILLCDEPTGNLDEATAQEIMKLLYEINESGTTVVVITHDRKLAEGSGKRIIRLEKGVVVSDV